MHVTVFTVAVLHHSVGTHIFSDSPSCLLLHLTWLVPHFKDYFPSISGLNDAPLGQIRDLTSLMLSKEG
jgi:hypothetical protein